jgi:hypothetical protein
MSISHLSHPKVGWVTSRAILELGAQEMSLPDPGIEPGRPQCHRSW